MDGMAQATLMVQPMLDLPSPPLPNILSGTKRAREDDDADMHLDRGDSYGSDNKKPRTLPFRTSPTTVHTSLFSTRPRLSARSLSLTTLDSQNAPTTEASSTIRSIDLPTIIQPSGDQGSPRAPSPPAPMALQGKPRPAPLSNLQLESPAGFDTDMDMAESLPPPTSPLIFSPALPPDSHSLEDLPSETLRAPTASIESTSPGPSPSYPRIPPPPSMHRRALTAASYTAGTTSSSASGSSTGSHKTPRIPTPIYEHFAAAATNNLSWGGMRSAPTAASATGSTASSWTAASGPSWTGFRSTPTACASSSLATPPHCAPLDSPIPSSARAAVAAAAAAARQSTSGSSLDAPSVVAPPLATSALPTVSAAANVDASWRSQRRLPSPISEDESMESPTLNFTKGLLRDLDMNGIKTPAAENAFSSQSALGLSNVATEADLSDTANAQEMRTGFVHTPFQLAPPPPPRRPSPARAATAKSIDGLGLKTATGDASAFAPTSSLMMTPESPPELNGTGWSSWPPRRGRSDAISNGVAGIGSGVGSAGIINTSMGNDNAGNYAIPSLGDAAISSPEIRVDAVTPSEDAVTSMGQQGVVMNSMDTDNRRDMVINDENKMAMAMANDDNEMSLSISGLNVHSNSSNTFLRHRPDATAMSSGRTANSPRSPSPKVVFSMGFRADCDKCRERVPGHYSHVLRA